MTLTLLFAVRLLLTGDRRRRTTIPIVPANLHAFVIPSALRPDVMSATVMGLLAPALQADVAIIESEPTVFPELGSSVRRDAAVASRATVHELIIKEVVLHGGRPEAVGFHRNPGSV